MTNDQIIDIIQNVAGVKKNLVALKAWKEEPQHIKKYEGNAFPGMCTQIGDVLQTGQTFHTNIEHQFCTGGVVAVGVAPPIPNAQKMEIIEVHEAISKGYDTIDIAVHYEDEMRHAIPPVPEKNAAVQIGLLKDINAPDLVLIFCTPGIADMLNRTYTYTFGEPIKGFGGNGGCPFLIQYPFSTKKPSFSYSDVAWRKYVGLADEELTMSFPYAALVRFAEHLPDVAERYHNYGKPPEE